MMVDKLKDNIIGLAVSAFLLGVVTGLWIANYAHGEQFHFNMTKQLNDETRLLALCIDSDIKIPNCEILYGGVNSSYGEALR